MVDILTEVVVLKSRKSRVLFDDRAGAVGDLLCKDDVAVLVRGEEEEGKQNGIGMWWGRKELRAPLETVRSWVAVPNDTRGEVMTL